MKQLYKTPKLYYVSNPENLSSNQLSSLSDEELAQYIQKNKKIECTKIYKSNTNIVTQETDSFNREI